MAKTEERRSPGNFQGVAPAVAAVSVGVPSLLAAWIALLFLAERLELMLQPHEIFAWMLSLIAAALLLGCARCSPQRRSIAGLAAAISWVVCVMTGLLFTWLAIDTLA